MRLVSLGAEAGCIVGGSADQRVVGVELKVCNRKKRRQLKLDLALDALDDKIRDHTLADPSKFPELFERQMVLNQVAAQRDGKESVQIQLVYKMLRRGYTWPEIEERLGQAPERVKRRLYRWMKKTGEA